MEKAWPGKVIQGKTLGCPILSPAFGERVGDRFTMSRCSLFVPRLVRGEDY